MLPIEKNILWYFFETFANVSLSFEFVDPEKIAKNSSKFVDRTSKKPHDNRDYQLSASAPCPVCCSIRPATQFL